MKLIPRLTLLKAFISFLFILVSISSNAQTLFFNKAYYYNNNYIYTQSDVASDIETDSSGYMINSHTWNYQTGNAWIHLIKINRYGDTLFSKSYGEPGYQMEALSMKKTKDFQHYIFSGVKSNPVTKEVKGLIFKTNLIGDTIWTRTYTSGLLKTILGNLTETESGDLIISGSTNNLNSNPDLYALKTDSAGNKIWDYIYGGNEQEW